MSIIRGSSLTGLTETVTALGGDCRAFVAGAGIRFDDVGRHDHYISLPRSIRLMELVATDLHTPDFGRRLAKQQGIEILGAVGLAGRNAATVGDAFAAFEKFMASYSPAISARIAPKGDPHLPRFEYSFLLDPLPPQAQAMELAMGVTLQVLLHLLGSTYCPVHVHFPHSPLTSPASYRDYYRCPAEFDAPVAGFTLRGEDLARALPADQLAQQTAVDYLARTVDEYRPTSTTLVRLLVRQALPVGEVGLAQIACQLDLHPKTLQRRLAAEGTMFGDTVDELRRETARHLLLDTDVGLDQLSRQIGYAEQSVLTRSCKRWFGMTPREMRMARHLPEQP